MKITKQRRKKKGGQPIWARPNSLNPSYPTHAARTQHARSTSPPQPRVRRQEASEPRSTPSSSSPPVVPCLPSSAAREPSAALLPLVPAPLPLAPAAPFLSSPCLLRPPSPAAAGCRPCARPPAAALASVASSRGRAARLPSVLASLPYWFPRSGRRRGRAASLPPRVGSAAAASASSRRRHPAPPPAAPLCLPVDPSATTRDPALDGPCPQTPPVPRAAHNSGRPPFLPASAPFGRPSPRADHHLVVLLPRGEPPTGRLRGSPSASPPAPCSPTRHSPSSSAAALAGEPSSHASRACGQESHLRPPSITPRVGALPASSPTL